MNTTDSLIKKYENLKGDALDNWQGCTEDAHKTMWEAYNLAYGQILSDLHNLKEYIPEAAQPVDSSHSQDDKKSDRATAIQWWNSLSKRAKSFLNPTPATGRELENIWRELKVCAISVASHSDKDGN